MPCCSESGDITHSPIVQKANRGCYRRVFSVQAVENYARRHSPDDVSGEHQRHAARRFLSHGRLNARHRQPAEIASRPDGKTTKDAFQHRRGRNLSRQWSISDSCRRAVSEVRNNRQFTARRRIQMFFETHLFGDIYHYFARRQRMPLLRRKIAVH